MKKRTIIIGIFILFLVGVISIIGTYAIDSTITEGNSSTADYLFNITLGNRTNREVVIPSYDSKIVDIKISNPNEFAMSYLLYIEGVNPNISVINIKDTEASGVLASKTVTIIQVFIQNNSSSDITIKIKDIVGFEKETLTLPDNSTSINKGNYYKAIVKSNNNTYGKVKPNIKLSTLNGIVKYEIVPNTGYKYKSTTCNGSIANNILTISNITSNINCEVVFEPIEVTVSFDTNEGEFSTTYTEAKEHTYTVPYSGTYKLEVWGAQGGSVSTTARGGYGGYATGVITLDVGEILYANVGGVGKTCSSGYCTDSGGNNGGGNALYVDQVTGGGGGATHIALSSGNVSAFLSKLGDLLLVAGGGGGGYQGHAGGYIGNTGKDYSTYSGYWGSGGTQKTGGITYWSGGNSSKITGSFGQGGQSSTAFEACGNSGGGGGYYGGGASSRGHGGAGGGSGYIGNSQLTNKYMYCYNCSTSDEESTKTYTTTNVSSRPISNYAKSEGGVAKITLIDEVSYATSYGQKYGSLPTPTKTGYTFLGWYTEPNGQGTKITEDTILSNVNAHTLYANWQINTYSITTNYYYYYQNTTWTHFDTRTDTATQGSSFAPYNITAPTGYYPSNDYHYYDATSIEYLGSGTVGTDVFIVDRNIIVNVHYYPNTYTITYDYRNNIYNQNTSTWTFSGNNSHVDNGYSYNGTTALSLASTSLYTGTQIPINEDKKQNTNYKLSIKAYRTIDFTGNLRAYSGTFDSTGSVISWNHGISINASNLPLNTWKEYNYSFNSGTYANWYYIYIDYDTENQGPVYVSDIRLDEYTTGIVTYDTNYTNLPTPTRSGYTFIGWFSNTTSKHDSSKTYKDYPLYYYADTYSDLYNAFQYDQDKLFNHYNNNGKSEGRRISQYISTDTFTGTSDMTLYAGWKANTYTITYNLNGGTAGSRAPTSGTYGSTVTVSNPTRSGYTFNGWTVSGTGASMSGTTLTIGAGNVTLTANWKINDSTPPTCSLSANSSTITASASDTGGSGLAYNGWSSSYSGTNSTSKSIAIGTHTYYVKDGAGNTGTCSATISATTKNCDCGAGFYQSGACYIGVIEDGKWVGNKYYKECDWTYTCSSGTKLSNSYCFKAN